MLPTVQLDDQALPQAGEIGDVWADRMLSTETHSGQLLTPEVLPEQLLSLGGIAPKLTGEV